jgi:hypothetical protein
VSDDADYERCEPMVVTVWSFDMRCTECGVLIPAGTRFVSLWPGDQRHEGRCPTPWTPRVIEGGLTRAPEQLSDRL